MAPDSRRRAWRKLSSTRSPGAPFARWYSPEEAKWGRRGGGGGGGRGEALGLTHTHSHTQSLHSRRGVWAQPRGERSLYLPPPLAAAVTAAASPSVSSVQARSAGDMEGVSSNKGLSYSRWSYDRWGGNARVVVTLCIYFMLLCVCVFVSSRRCWREGGGSSSSSGVNPHLHLHQHLQHSVPRALLADRLSLRSSIVAQCHTPLCLAVVIVVVVNVFLIINSSLPPLTRPSETRVHVEESRNEGFQPPVVTLQSPAGFHTPHLAGTSLR